MRISVLILALSVSAAPAGSFAATTEGLICPTPAADQAQQCTASGFATCPTPMTTTPASYADDEAANAPRLLTRSEIRAELEAVRLSPRDAQRIAQLSDPQD